MRRFLVATDEEILDGETTDVYFSRTMEVLEAEGLADTRVVAELTVGSLPKGWPWAVLCGIEEALRLLEGHDVNVRCLPEGTLFPARDDAGVRFPVMTIEGPYSAFARLETPLLGLLCHSSGVATVAARCRLAAGDRSLMAFGVRRMHPAMAPMLDRSSYIGGCDGVSTLIGAKCIGREPMGTIPHALILMIGDEEAAYRAFDRVVDPSVPRIALIDTFSDEKFGALKAVEAVPGLEGIRLDTPGSRRGNLRELVQEIRWELDLRGHEGVRILLSGGLDEGSIADAVDYGVDGFGVGTCMTNAPTVDLALDLIEREGAPVAKRGKMSGRKSAFTCTSCGRQVVASGAVPECDCGCSMVDMMRSCIESGARIAAVEDVEVIRGRVLSQLAPIPADTVR